MYFQSAAVFFISQQPEVGRPANLRRAAKWVQCPARPNSIRRLCSLVVINVFLHDSPYPVIHRTEVRTQIWHDEVHSLVSQQLNGLTCMVLRCDVVLESAKSLSM